MTTQQHKQYTDINDTLSNFFNDIYHPIINQATNSIEYFDSEDVNKTWYKVPFKALVDNHKHRFTICKLNQENYSENKKHFYYVGHKTGSKSKNVQDMVINFLFHKSYNNFSIYPADFLH